MIDTSKVSITNVNVTLIAGKDTLRTTTNDRGHFSFSKVKSETFLLNISAIGYLNFSSSYTFGKDKLLEIKPIDLKASTNMLKTVEIIGKPNPMRVMQDTLEYNAAAYQVFEGDNVADLLKQLPGLEVDGDNNVKTMGTEMVKLRVNGKDFFTSNIKDFIGKLPAAIVSKIQIIDDFGDEANFTGLKVGEPIKMLNIVTKPGVNKGAFGNSSIKGGSNQSIGGNISLSSWNDTKQSMGDVSYNTLNNGAGISTNSNFSGNFRNKLGKYGAIRMNFGSFNNSGAFENEQDVETVNPLGIFRSQSKSQGDNSSGNHNLNSNYDFNNKRAFITATLNASYSLGNNSSNSFNVQSGLMRQDLRNINLSKNNIPRISGNINFSQLQKKKQNSFSANMGFSTSVFNSNQNINTNTLYYDQANQTLIKDSVLNRDLISETNSQSLSLGANYSLGLKKPKDSLGRQSLNFTYNASISTSENILSTYVFDQHSTLPKFIDSLSTKYTSLTIAQSLGVSYNYSNSKTRYNIGFNLRPNLMDNRYINLNQRIINNTLNYSPNLNISKTIAKGKTISANYSGNNNAPPINQLQPIRNTQNLQNIVIGNPNLKPYFRHSLTANYNMVKAKTGLSLQSGLNFSATQNEIVSNVRIIPDTLNSLKQETRFENTNGSYSANGNYNFNIPLKKNKFAINYGGNLGFTNKAIFINNIREFNKGINFSQRIRGTVNAKKISASANANYTFSSNTNMLNGSSIMDIYYANLGTIAGTTFFDTHNFRLDLNTSLRFTKLLITSDLSYNITTSDAQFGMNNARNVRNLEMNLSSRITLDKQFFLNLNASKRINQGYSLANVNPFILNTSITKAFFREKRLNLTISANDIFNQGNNLTRYVSGNSIVDSRSNLVTRVVSFGLSYNLSKFGGQNFRVDPD